MTETEATYHGVKVLVTGGDGFIGSHLVERLAAAGAEVTALALYNAFGGSGWLDDLPQALHSAIRIEHGDMRDPAFVMQLCEGQQVIFHLAALITIPYSYIAAQSYVDVNVTGTVNLLEAARVHKPRRVVMTSTSEVYGTAITTPIDEEHPLQAQSPYAASKIAADMMASAYALSFSVPAYVLRPFNTYGPRQSERAVISSVIRQAIDPRCEAIRVGNITPTRDFVFVGDTVAAFLAMARSDAVKPGRAYNAGTGTAVSIGEMVELVRAGTATNKPVETEAARIRPKDSEVRTLLADAKQFHAATGWTAGTALGDGLEQTIEWWRARSAAGKLREHDAYVL